MVVVLLVAVVILLDAPDVRAERPARARCQHVAAETAWPAVLAPDEAPATEVAPAEARGVVAAFRRAWQRRGLPRAGAVGRALAPCMRSDRDYYVRRVSGASALRRLTALGDRQAAAVLWGTAASLSEAEWIWEVTFSGWIDSFRPDGAFGGFLTPDRRAIAIVHWPEG